MHSSNPNTQRAEARWLSVQGHLGLNTKLPQNKEGQQDESVSKGLATKTDNLISGPTGSKERNNSVSFPLTYTLTLQHVLPTKINTQISIKQMKLTKFSCLLKNTLEIPVRIRAQLSGLRPVFNGGATASESSNTDSGWLSRKTRWRKKSVKGPCTLLQFPAPKHSQGGTDELHLHLWSFTSPGKPQVKQTAETPLCEGQGQCWQDWG